MTASILSRYIDPDLLARLAELPIEPRGLVGGTLAGAHKSPSSGFAVEFAGHRDYVVGDDPRHIDWRLYFKRDRLSIKQYELETNFVCHLILDLSASMRFGDGAEQKLSYSTRAATTLGYAIVSQNDKVSLATFADRVLDFLPPGNSLAQIHRMMEHLDRIEPAEKTNLADCLVDLSGRMGRRAIVMIFSDFFTDLDALEAALQRMKYCHHEVVLFHVLHHTERSFDFQGSVQFLGLEDESDFLIQTEDFRRGYLDAFARYEAHFDEICRRNAIERVSLDTDRNFGDDLVKYISQRQRVQLR